MGIIKKIFKGVGKVFKKIGKAVKRQFKRFGKFMNKIGIVGQIAMMFILPGIGNALLSNLGGWAATLGAKSSLLAKGLGKVLAGAHRFGTAIKAGFSSITNAVTEFGKTALNKVGFNIEGAATNFFSGTDSAFARTKAGFKNVGDVWKAGAKDGTITAVKEVTVDEMAKNLGMSKENLLKINVGNDGILGNKIAQGTQLNTDLFSFEATKGNISNAISEEFSGLSSAASNKNIVEAAKDFKPPTGTEVTGTAPVTPSDSLLAPDPDKVIETATATGEQLKEQVKLGSAKNIVETTTEKTPFQEFIDDPIGVGTEEVKSKFIDFRDKFAEKPIQTTMSLLGGSEEEIDLGRGFATPTYTPDIDIGQIGFSELRLPTAQEYYQDNSAQQTYYGTVQSTLAQVARQNEQDAFGFYRPPVVGTPGAVMQGMR